MHAPSPIIPDDLATDTDDILDKDNCIKIDSDDGETAQFIVGDIGSPHDHLMIAPESEQMDSTTLSVSIWRTLLRGTLAVSVSFLIRKL